MVLYSTAQYFHLKPYYLRFHSPMTIRRDVGQCQGWWWASRQENEEEAGRPKSRKKRIQRSAGFYNSTQGQGFLKKNGQFELVSEEGPSCFYCMFWKKRKLFPKLIPCNSGSSTKTRWTFFRDKLALSFLLEKTQTLSRTNDYKKLWPFDH